MDYNTIGWVFPFSSGKWRREMVGNEAISPDETRIY
jgi:hypothetical protein